MGVFLHIGKGTCLGECHQDKRVPDICKQFVRVLVVVFGIIAQYPRKKRALLLFRLSDLTSSHLTAKSSTLWI